MISNPFRPANSPTSSNTASSLKLLLKDPSFCSGHLLVPFPASCISAGSGIDATRLTPSDHVKVHLFRPKGRPFITDKQALESFPPPSDGAEALVHQSPPSTVTALQDPPLLGRRAISAADATAPQGLLLSNNRGWDDGMT